MKLLFDENLPPSLVGRLASEFPESASVLRLGLGSRPDSEIVSYDKQHGFAIASKDADFYWHCVAHGYPPKVVWIRAGNVKPGALAELLKAAKSQLDAFELSDEAYLILQS